MNVEVNPNEDTEWNDILRAHGVIPERPPSPSAQLEEALEEAVRHAHENRLEHKTLDELDEIDEDGLEDEEFIEIYRKKRMAEIQEMAKKQKFGSLVMISKPEYTQEITDASKNDQFVLVHIAYEGVPQSKLLTGLFRRISEQFPEIKFVQIDARQINERYPSENCPTILVYKNTDVVKQYVTLNGLGGNSTSMDDMRKLLVTLGAVDESDRRIEAGDDDRDGYLNRNRYDSDDDFD
ncbi:Plp2p [Sugiyamaella lignohabitans]|uniref:Plp2p n=1 Tax=Sugiyamaella lignohabitans TaxID=796027 RepID=A0A167C9M2_9ASCO|nr:Plp2p [Sugiyamaella lignohabitans]ANB11402.1 Plp2p [Sugiyamaella lignohabitans]